MNLHFLLAVLGLSAVACDTSFGLFEALDAHSDFVANEFIAKLMRLAESKNKAALENMYEPTFDFLQCHGIQNRETTVRNLIIKQAVPFRMYLQTSYSDANDDVTFDVLVDGTGEPRPFKGRYLLHNDKLVRGRELNCPNRPDGPP